VISCFFSSLAVPSCPRRWRLPSGRDLDTGFHGITFADYVINHDKISGVSLIRRTALPDRNRRAYFGISCPVLISGYCKKESSPMSMHFKGEMVETEASTWLPLMRSWRKPIHSPEGQQNPPTRHGATNKAAGSDFSSAGPKPAIHKHHHW
jgi:hypothetical protein